MIEALTAIGVANPGVMEHGFRSATVGGAFECRIAYVYSYGVGTPQEPTDVDVLSEITMPGGIPAKVVSFPFVGDGVRFVCSGVGFDVTSLSANLDPGSGDADEAQRIANLMVEHLDCS